MAAPALNRDVITVRRVTDNPIMCDARTRRLFIYCLWRTLAACRVDICVDVRKFAQTSGHRHKCRCGTLQACATRRVGSEACVTELYETLRPHFSEHRSLRTGLAVRSARV